MIENSSSFSFSVLFSLLNAVYLHFFHEGNGVLRVFLRWESVFVRAASAACAVGKGLGIAVTLLDDVFISFPVSFSVTLLDEEPLVCFSLYYRQ